MIIPAPDAAPATAPRAAYLRYAGQLVVLFAGLLLFALGSACTWKAHVGLGPWECFHLGLSLHAPITQGQANILTGAGVIGLSLFLGVRPGVATICNMIFVGLFFDAWNTILPDLGGADLPARLAFDVAGVLIIGIGSGLYIRAALGAGPRDSLMLALARRSGGRIAIMRGAVELSALAFGFLLGGPIGAGTLIHALGVGPAVAVGFRLFRVETRH